MQHVCFPFFRTVQVYEAFVNHKTTVKLCNTVQETEQVTENRQHIRIALYNVCDTHL